MLVHGDTSTAAAAAVAGFQMRIPVVHVEAGLRTNELDSPFPEESNRQIIDRVATLYLAPITENEQNLIRENIEHEQVFVTGNTGIDALRYVIAETVASGKPDVSIAATLQGNRKLVVVTAHRRESWGGGIARIGQAVATLARAHPDVAFLVATHPNPDVRAEMVSEIDGIGNIVISGAQTYPDFARLLARAEFVISDSGGVQEEAPSVNTPVLVTRDVTERAEGVEAGTLQLVGTDPARIVAAAEELLSNPAALAKMRDADNPYGDGHASERIVAALEWLGGFGPEPERFHCGFSRKAVLAAAGYPTDRDTISDRERLTLAADWLAERES
jgi:UDP-N-acetylglucosamine 2-epimerase (non-hydrolysing)